MHTPLSGPKAGHPAALALAATAWLVLCRATVSAHPVNMDCVDQQFVLRIEPGRLVVQAVVRHHEFTSLVRRKAMDSDGDGAISPAEARAYAEKAARDLLGALALTVDGKPVALRPVGTPRVDLEGENQVVPFNHVERADFEAAVDAAPGSLVRVGFQTKAFPDNPGFFRYWVAGEGVRVVWRSFKEQPPVDPNTVVAPGPPLRRVEFAYVVGGGTGEMAGETAGPPERPRARRFAGAFRAFQRRVAAYFRGEFRLWAFALLVVLAFVYGAFHALAPGHAKTITAAYLIGSRSRPWHAVVLGLVVTVSHTWSIYTLALVTHIFYGGEVRAQTQGLVMAVSGGLVMLLGLGQFVRRLRGRDLFAHSHPHGDHHHHEHPHDHQHDHDHDHPHDHGHPHDHPHDHGLPHGASGGADGVKMKSLLLLGFSGGIVPCPGALWIYFLSLSLHRTLEGIILITALGAGLATVLIVVGLVTVRLRRSVVGAADGGAVRLFGRLPGLWGRLGERADRALGWVGRRLWVLAPCVIAAVGLVLVLWGLTSAGVIGG